jgi:hypothetical protein
MLSTTTSSLQCSCTSGRGGVQMPRAWNEPRAADDRSSADGARPCCVCRWAVVCSYASARRMLGVTQRLQQVPAPCTNSVCKPQVPAMHQRCEFGTGVSPAVLVVSLVPPAPAGPPPQRC